MNTDNKNMNTDNYTYFDENFNTAIDLFEKNISHEQILELLKNGNIIEKQVAALKLEDLNSFEEAMVLVHNLVGQDGKIREAVSLKINELRSNKYLCQHKIYDIFLQAVIDINGNICRNIINTIDVLKTNEDFCTYFIPKLLDMTESLIDVVKDFDFQEGKYKINKEVFKLYWCIETIYHLTEMTENDRLFKILSVTKSIEEYTIREKTAKILSKISDNERFESMKKELKSDRNYYVRRF